MDKKNLIEYLKDAIIMESQLHSLNKIKNKYETQIQTLKCDQNSCLKEKEYFNGTRTSNSKGTGYCLMVGSVKIGEEIVDDIRRGDDDHLAIDEKRYGYMYGDDFKKKSYELFARELPHSLWHTEEMNTLLNGSAEYFRDNVYKENERASLDVQNIYNKVYTTAKRLGILATIGHFILSCILFLIFGLLNIQGIFPFIIIIFAFIKIPSTYGKVSKKYKESSDKKLGKEQRKLYAQYYDNYNTWLNEYEKPIYIRMKELYENDMAQKREWYQKRIDVLTAEYNDILTLIADTKGILDKIYAKDFIHPKYQNFVAVSQIYDYLTTGRCDELTGAHGAYNLFENELRLNIIIEQLDTIINQLNREYQKSL